MSISEYLPTRPGSVKPRFPVKRFQAVFDGGLGIYDFNATGVAAFNKNQVLIPINTNSIYLIERQSFYANVSESAWLEAMGAEADFPFFSLHFEKSAAKQVLEEPVWCVNFLDAVEQVSYYRTANTADNLLISFGGQVGQSFPMVGVDPVLAEVNFTIYQITDDKWCKDFLKGDHPILRAFPQLQEALHRENFRGR
jgi:hypothetical protein